MSVRYREATRCLYLCDRLAVDYGGQRCQQLAGACLDQFVTQQALAALAPAALELSLAAAGQVERERAELDRLWRQRLERAAYQTERARRQYDLVEPENRLVARQLERAWEEQLAAQQQLQATYQRFADEQPRVLTDRERVAIRQLAADVPALWNASTTTHADRKALLRQLVERVTVDVHGDSERVGVVVDWAGGACTKATLIRPVARLEQLSYYPQLIERVRELARQQLPAAAIADRLNAEGYRPPKRRDRFGEQGLQQLLRRLGGPGLMGRGRILDDPFRLTGTGRTGPARTSGGCPTWPGCLGCRRSRCSPGSNAAGSPLTSNPSRRDGGSSGPTTPKSSGSASAASGLPATTHVAGGSRNKPSMHSRRQGRASEAPRVAVQAEGVRALCDATTRQPATFTGAVCLTHLDHGVAAVVDVQGDGGAGAVGDEGVVAPVRPQRRLRADQAGAAHDQPTTRLASKRGLGHLGSPAVGVVDVGPGVLADGGDRGLDQLGLTDRDREPDAMTTARSDDLA